jgi:hypothetical protein
MEREREREREREVQFITTIVLRLMSKETPKNGHGTHRKVIANDPKTKEKEKWLLSTKQTVSNHFSDGDDCDIRSKSE